MAQPELLSFLRQILEHATPLFTAWSSRTSSVLAWRRRVLLFQPGVAELPPTNHGAADLTPSQPRADKFRPSEADKLPSTLTPQYLYPGAASDHLQGCIILVINYR